MAIAREERALHAVLVIDHKKSMANAHRDLLTEAGADCHVASGAETGWQALVEHNPCVVVLALGLPEQGAARFLKRMMTERDGERPLVIGTRFQEEKPTPELPVDAVIVRPCPPEALLHATGVRRRDGAAMDPLACAAALLTTSALGRAGRESMLDMIADVREAFAADACIVWRAQTQETWNDGGRELSQEELGRAARFAAAAAEEQTTIVTQALVVDATSDDYENAFESHHAVVGGHEGATLTVSLVHRGFVRLGVRERQLLEGFVRRIAHELSWQNAQERLVAELDAIREIGGLDPMLGIWSRSTLRRLLEMLESWCRRLGEPLSVAVVDVCGMGRINDAHGHHEGDALLKHVAEVAVYVVRAYDVVARYGGDEIAIVFGGARVEDAVRVVERLQAALTSQPYQTDDGVDLQLKLGAGVTVLGGPEDTGDKALARAAAAAARAAVEGRTVVATHQRPRRTGDETPVSLDRALEGVTLGGTYRILHEIGSGGGGGVYRGEDLGLRRPVAVKVLRPDFARDEELVERFRDEAAILASLRHNHLVQVYAFGVEDGIAYFVMELVEGESLHDAVARSVRESTQIPISKIATVVRQIGSALDTLHRSGVIHRDVKPANILLDPFRSRSVLVDVGIAIRPGEKAPFAGTPGYVAPEAVESLKLEGSSDVYGLAVTVYELLTLRLPWPATDNVLSMLRAQREKTPAPPSTHRPELAPVDDILLRALAVDPTKRWPDVNGFATALCDALAAVAAAPISAREATEISGPDSSETAKSLGAAPTLSWTPADAQRPSTRGVVFRSIPRVLGPRNAVAWRVQLKAQAQHLAEALSPSAPPLGWLPTEWLIELLRSEPPGVRDPLELGRDLGRAAVRATFRRFFPMSTATLTPNGTLHALPQIWPHYHSWGRLHVVNAARDQAQVRMQKTPGADVICAWVQGMLEQLLILSGADAVRIDHPQCEAHGADACRFDARWTWVPRSDRSWR